MLDFRDVIWTATDRWGRLVQLTHECWEQHIIGKRPHLEPHAARFTAVVTDPMRIQRDADYPSFRHNYYRPAVFRGQEHKYVKVVVEFKEPDELGLIVGTVVTIHLVDAIPIQEERLWPP